MELTKEKALVIGAVIVVVAALLVWQFGLPLLSIYSYAKKVPIQFGYDEVNEYWILSSIVNEQEKFRMVLEANSEESLDEGEAVTQSEVGILLTPQRPYSKTNLDVYSIRYRTAPALGEGKWGELPSYDINDAGWLTTARYNIGVWKNGEELSSRDVEVNYQQERVIEINTPEGKVTVNNLGILPQGVEVPSGDLVIVEDPYGVDHVFNKADVVQWLNTWNEWMFSRPESYNTYEKFWERSNAKGWIPNDVQLTHVSTVDIEGEYDNIKLTYSGIVFAGDITVYIPDELADTIIIQLFKPITEIVNVDPSPLPDTYEGQSAVFNVEVKNVGTEGTIDISCSSSSWSFTPLTETSQNMDADETFTFKFKAYALNVLEDKDTTINIFAQGRGGTDTYNLKGKILDAEGYTPPSGDGGTPDGDGDGESDWMLWLLIGCVVVIIVVVAVVYARKK